MLGAANINFLKFILFFITKIIFLRLAYQRKIRKSSCPLEGVKKGK